MSNAQGDSAPPPRPDADVRTSRFTVAAILAFILSLIFSSLLGELARSSTNTFWAFFAAHLVAFVLAGWVSSRIARVKGTLVVVAGVALPWGAIVLLGITRLPAHDSLAILAYVVSAVLSARAQELYRRHRALSAA